jgi:hypothetical protein
MQWNTDWLGLYFFNVVWGVCPNQEKQAPSAIHCDYPRRLSWLVSAKGKKNLFPLVVYLYEMGRSVRVVGLLLPTLQERVASFWSAALFQFAPLLNAD